MIIYRNFSPYELHTLQPDESQQHRRWRHSVLQAHIATTNQVNEAIRNVRTAKKTTRGSIEGAREVINDWNKYESRFQSACQNLRKRVDKSLEVERQKQIRRQAYLNRILGHRKPTKCYLAKKALKYVSQKRNRAFTW